MTRGRVPLDRALSKLGVASRTDARRLIAGGQVSVGGATVTDAGRLVTPERDVIAVDGIPARRAARRLIAFHKPRGVVTTRRDPEGRRTIYDVLGPAAHGLQAIGRLDRASTGLLLLTNDTRLADALTDPGRQVPRTYVVTVRGRLDPARAETLTAGLDVAGTSRRRPSNASRRPRSRFARSRAAKRTSSSRSPRAETASCAACLRQSGTRSRGSIASRSAPTCSETSSRESGGNNTRRAAQPEPRQAHSPQRRPSRRRTAQSNSLPCFLSQRSASRHCPQIAPTFRQKRRP